MATRKGVKDTSLAVLFEVPSDSDLLSRVEKISSQTGISPSNLFQKWILQEEFTIGVMQNSKMQAAEKIEEEARPAVGETPKEKKGAEVDSRSPEYRTMLIKKAAKLKKEGLLLRQIAQIFNDESLPTISGTGKWHPGTVSTLLK